MDEQNIAFLMKKARILIEQARANTNLNKNEIAEKSVQLAAVLLQTADLLANNEDKTWQKNLAAMLSDPQGKSFTIALVDQSLRSNEARRAADQVNYLIKRYGIPQFFPFGAKIALKAFKYLSKFFPSIAMHFLKKSLHHYTNKVILSDDIKALKHHIASRSMQKIQTNLNHIGETVLSEYEALQRLLLYEKDLSSPYIDYISVKISTICSQLDLLAWDETLELLHQRLGILLHNAKKYSPPKIVNLDMEEYRDLYLTAELFMRVIHDVNFLDQQIGIALQSYLPDSLAILERIIASARERSKKGGAPIKVRIVKGANLAMEHVESSLKGWPQAPYLSKAETDANFKSMLDLALRPENASIVHIGIGSHNLFDIAFVMLLSAQRSCEKYVTFEMLEGIAEHMRKSIQSIIGKVLLYSPAANQDEFQYALAYLTRRLDENTDEENFLRHSFDLTVDSIAWKEQANRFKTALRDAETVSHHPRRQQNRNHPCEAPNLEDAFSNESDTDWSLSHNREWIHSIIKNQKEQKANFIIPLVINGMDVGTPQSYTIEKGTDPSRPKNEFYNYFLANASDIETAIVAAKQTSENFKHFSSKLSNTLMEQNAFLLAQTAQQIRTARGRLIAAMLADTGKPIQESDTEISEAIDFCEYYRRNLYELMYLHDLQWQPKGTCLVAPPWNFPCSISIGCIAAALVSGNSVIYKPPQESVYVGWLIANLFWQAGFDKQMLQFITCRDEPEGSLLIADNRIDTILLTGATATAKKFLNFRPGVNLIAETGGKNAIIVTALADRDLAIRDIIHSAFSYAGQKCSACSLLILEKEVYDDPHFLQQLKHATQSLIADSAWNPKTKVPPLIRQAEGALLRGLTTLENEETWLLEPHRNKAIPNLWSPGIKMNVKEGSFNHTTEFFGPLLSVLRADNLQDAICIANSTPYALTSGLHSLDDREQQLWIEKIQAGNLYINRTITGAIVQRQPFGGYKSSSFGPGAKAGGPNYVAQLMHVKQQTLPDEVDLPRETVILLDALVNTWHWDDEEMKIWKASIGSYAYFWSHYFSQDHDPSQILGQKNILRYIPKNQLIVRIQEQDSPLDIMRTIAATSTCKCPLLLSSDTSFCKQLYELSKQKSQKHTFNYCQIEIQSETQFLENIAKEEACRIRFLSLPTPKLIQELAILNICPIIAPIIANGRIELIRYLQEIAISHDYHRYGYIATDKKNKLI